MKIAYLTGQYPKVSHTFVRREIRGLEARGHEVVRLSVRDGDSGFVDPEDKVEAEKTRVFFGASPSSWAGALAAVFVRHPLRLLAQLLDALRRGLVGSGVGVARRLAYLAEAAWFLAVLRREGAEHVHVHFGRNAACVARIIEALGGPGFSMTVHGPDEFDDPVGHELGEKVAAATFTAAISSYTSGQLRRWASIDDWNRIEVVHCTVDESFFAAAEPVAPDCNRFICVGRLCAQKGQLVLIDALAALLDQGTDARLVLAGDGEMRPEVEARVAQRGIADHVEITGWISEQEVRKHLLAARCMVLPSFAEGLPVVIMEALAMRRPVISTFTAGIPELVTPDCGWLVPSGDVESLTSVLHAAATASTTQLDEMGRAGAARVRAEHTQQGEVAKLERLFQA